VHLQLTPINYAQIFFLAQGAHLHPVHPLATTMITSLYGQGSYRNLTVVSQTLPEQNYFFFSRLFKAFCEQNITK